MSNDTTPTLPDEAAHERKRLTLLIRSMDERIDDLMTQIEHIESKQAEYQSALDTLNATP